MAGTEVQYYHEIALTIPSVDVDPVSNYIIENICGGLLLEDEDEDFRTTIKFYIANGTDIDDKLKALSHYLTEINPALEKIELRLKKIKNLDWIDQYQRSVEPVTIGDSIVIKPPWSTEYFPGRVEVLIEPKMAFGTGRHESTRGTLMAMASLEMKGKRVLDLGCGSGILSIYAAKKGASDVLACDIDLLAVENCTENIELNRVADRCRVFEGSLDAVPQDRQFDLIVVNIIKAVIVPIIGRLKPMLSSGGHLILAGFLDQDRPDVESELKAHSLDSFEVRSDNEWVTYLVHRL